MTDFDPELVQIRPAATLLLVDDRPGLKVFMMKRNANVRFAGGMWVFPGGAVDQGDEADKDAQLCVNRTAGEANQALDVEDDGLAYYVAAVREAFEEAGVLFARDASTGEPVGFGDQVTRQRFDRYRDAVNEGSEAFSDVIERESLRLDVGEFHYVARFITPFGQPRRFDTRFFVSRMPDFQDPIHDDGELVNSSWLSPAEVLSQAESGEMIMLTPTLRMVERLALFDSAEAVINAARKDQAVERIPLRGSADEDRPEPEPGWLMLRP